VLWLLKPAEMSATAMMPLMVLLPVTPLPKCQVNKHKCCQKYGKLDHLTRLSI
jgi:hypothetical protein